MKGSRNSTCTSGLCCPRACHAGPCHGGKATAARASAPQSPGNLVSHPLRVPRSSEPETDAGLRPETGPSPLWGRGQLPLPVPPDPLHSPINRKRSQAPPHCPYFRASLTGPLGSPGFLRFKDSAGGRGRSLGIEPGTEPLPVRGTHPTLHTGTPFPGPASPPA